ncbi:MAG TPA: ABC transporter ATP-binding protein, partial [Planctomycetota bacterium]|nr:ABC transporter ATP-binding protein [Planctomycetota bacterium]
TVSHLTKRYGDLLAVDDISFSAQGGAIYGLLGPNGAGKSTTIGCISGLLECGAGNVTVAGFDTASHAREAKAALGVVPQELALYEDLTARENLQYWGGAYGLRGASLAQRADELLRRIGLADRPKDAIKKFSGGMKRRLNFACALLHRPKVLLLDEPTVGVDPQSRVALIELVREEVALGTCVLYTTHYMEEAETLCDRVGIIDRGKLIAQGTLGELRKLLGERDLLRLNGVFDAARLQEGLQRLGDVEIVAASPEQITLALANASQRLPSLFSALHACGADVRETTLTQPSLETLFIKLTGKELRE